VRRVIALIASVLLVLTIAGPVVADPINKAQFPNVYVFTCEDGTEIPAQNAHGVPGWGLDWEPGDTPWLLMGFTVTWDGGSYVRPLPPGLAGTGKLFGPCKFGLFGTPESAWPFTDAWFLKR
jgi:hypothetical protein